MKITQELECSIVILDFLLDDEDHHNYSSFDDIPKFKKMNIILSKNNTDMLPFTNYVNSKYFGNSSLWDKSPKEFFSTTKSRLFYRRLIRKLKLDLICQNFRNSE